MLLLMLILGHGNSEGPVGQLRLRTNLQHLKQTKELMQSSTTSPSEGENIIEEGNPSTATDLIKNKGKGQISVMLLGTGPTNVRKSIVSDIFRTFTYPVIVIKRYQIRLSRPTDTDRIWKIPYILDL